MGSKIDSFWTMGCIEEVPLGDLSNCDNRISTRWVLTLKTDKNGKQKKARLVARGFEEVGNELISRESFVASSASKRMVLQVCVEKQQ